VHPSIEKEMASAYMRYELLNHSRWPGIPSPAELSVRGAQMVDIAMTYWQSVFCLQPIGDGVSRAGIIDALLLGCIPVLLHPGQVEQWAWQWGDWVKNATVLFDFDQVLGGAVDPIAELLELSEDRVAALQDTIAKHAHTMHYSLRSSSKQTMGTGLTETLQDLPDALDVTLHGCWARAQLLSAGAKYHKDDKKHFEFDLLARTLHRSFPPVDSSQKHHRRCAQTDE